MATPTGPRADAARGFYARERRRKKQDQKDFDIAGFESSPFRVLLLAVNVGGSGYTLGDTFLVSGGTFSVQCLGKVAAESGGVVTAVSVLIPGAYTVSPGVGAATVAQTGGGDNLLTVDVTLSALFDFGAVAAGASSANALTLPAAIPIALGCDVAQAAGDMGVENVTDGVTSFTLDACPAGGVVNLATLQRVGVDIRIARSATAPAGTVGVYFRGPKSQLIQIGTATFT